jgi:DNA-binding CsgD family transcriptional regulator
MGGIGYWIYWFVAYTAGVICLTLDVFVFAQKKASPIDLVFHGILNLFTICFIIGEYLLYVNHFRLPENLLIKSLGGDYSLVFCLLAVTYIAPIWAHSKKQRPLNPKLKRGIGILCVVLSAAYVVSIFGRWDAPMSFVVYSVMMIVYVYTGIILFKRPSSRVHSHFMRLERTYAILNLLFLPTLVLFDIFYTEIPKLQALFPQRFYTFPLYYMAFCIITGIENIYLLKNVGEKRMAPAGNDTTDGIPTHLVDKYGITPREAEIIALLLVGDSYTEIGVKLFIAHSTVKTHVQRIYKKTCVTNKIQLINLIKPAI